MNKKIITGHWDGQPIWREQTPVEKLCEAGLTEEQGKLFELYNELIGIYLKR